MRVASHIFEDLQGIISVLNGNSIPKIQVFAVVVAFRLNAVSTSSANIERLDLGTLWVSSGSSGFPAYLGCLFQKLQLITYSPVA
jgi:hypothetical protein